LFGIDGTRRLKFQREFLDKYWRGNMVKKRSTEDFLGSDEEKLCAGHGNLIFSWRWYALGQNTKHMCLGEESPTPFLPYSCGRRQSLPFLFVDINNCI
jgi:hypothetical protein